MIVFVGVVIAKVVAIAVWGWLIGLVQFLVPNLLDGGNLAITEVEPLLHLGALFDAFLVQSLLVLIAIKVVKRFLSDGAQLKSNLDDLAKVCA